MPFNTYAYFYVREFDCPVEQITELLQIEPKIAWSKNDVGVNGRLRTFSNWELHSPVPRNEAFQDTHLEILLNLLHSRRAAILQVIAQYKCGLQGVGYYTDENSGFHMSRELIARIAAFGLPVDFDLYCGSGLESVARDQSAADSSSGTHWDARIVKPEGVPPEYRVAPFADAPLQNASNGVGSKERDFDPPLTAEDLASIAQLTASQLALIDEALLASASKNWRKLARVACAAMDYTKPSVVGIPDIYFAQRIARLVSLGKLEAQGDMRRMRYSEVRFPSAWRK